MPLIVSMITIGRWAFSQLAKFSDYQLLNFPVLRRNFWSTRVLVVRSELTEPDSEVSSLNALSSLSTANLVDSASLKKLRYVEARESGENA